MKMIQRQTCSVRNFRSDGTEVGDSDHMVTETLIRGMYRYWREVMEA